jgi:hypothetical protein
VAGIITMSPGHDASYLWRQVGSVAKASPSRQGGEVYYLSPVEKNGEPPGRGRRDGVAEMGFRDGQIIERDVFERLYGKFLDPRDLSDGHVWGRRHSGSGLPRRSTQRWWRWNVRQPVSAVPS